MPSRITRAVAISLVLSISSATAVTASPAQDAYENGTRLVDKHDYVEAIAFLNLAITLDPKNANAYAKRGNCFCLVNKQYQNAIEDYTKAIVIEPKNWQFHALRADAYFNLGLHEKMREDINMVISLNPKNSAAYRVRGDLNVAQSQYRKAIEDYTKAISLAPSNAEYYSLRAEAYEKLAEEDRSMSVKLGHKSEP